MKKKLTRFLLSFFIFVFILCVIAIILFYFMWKPVTKLTNLSEISTNEPVFTRIETYSKWNRGKLKELPHLSGQSVGSFEIDLRSCDISGYDLSEYQDELNYVDFDTDTIWPNQLPSGFDPQKIMELGKNPGLDVKQLHEQGITGKGVNIAIIDQALLLEHNEYKDSIMLYELLHCQDTSAQMHGPAVTSIAIGKTVGVAPDAKVYYIASTFGTFSPFGFTLDLSYMADGIYRVLEINNVLPEDEKIKVISISRGFGGNEKGEKKVIEAIEAAKKGGVFVITTSTEMNYDFTLAGLGRRASADPDDTSSYAPGIFWADDYFDGGYFSQIQNLLLVPMDSRSYASFTGISDYAYSSIGGFSWTCPWLAGLYALCLQVNPDITPEDFINIAFETGKVIHLDNNNDLGTVIDPLGILDYLRR